MPILLNGFTEHTINTGEVEIAYSVGPNNGPTLLLLHGVTSRRDGFMNVAEALKEKHRVIAIDQRGHGYSGHTPGKYDREDHARDIKFILENVCKEPTVVWGHSMGGGNAIAMAQDPPVQLKALVLEDAAIFGKRRPMPTLPSTSDEANSTMNAFQVSLDIVEAGLSHEEMTAKIVESFPDSPAYYPAWKAESLTQMDIEILRSVVGGKSRGGGDDPAATLANISCPVLLMQADPEKGGILPDDFVAEVVPDRDDWTTVKIAGAGHNINRDHPEQVLPIVLPWLEAQRRRNA